MLERKLIYITRCLWFKVTTSYLEKVFFVKSVLKNAIARCYA
jgi:hypothetical protein